MYKRSGASPVLVPTVLLTGLLASLVVALMIGHGSPLRPVAVLAQNPCPVIQNPGFELPAMIDWGTHNVPAEGWDGDDYVIIANNIGAHSGNQNLSVLWPSGQAIQNLDGSGMFATQTVTVSFFRKHPVRVHLGSTLVEMPSSPGVWLQSSISYTLASNDEQIPLVFESLNLFAEIDDVSVTCSVAPTLTPTNTPTEPSTPTDTPTMTPTNTAITVPSATSTAVPGTAVPTATETPLPAGVNVMLITSDGGDIPDETKVCVGDVCQTADGVSADAVSGVILSFADLEPGEYQVIASETDPYSGATGSVTVVAGEIAEVTLELTIDAQPATPVVEPTVPEASNAPVVVLPSTGSGDARPATDIALILLTIAAVGALSFAARWRSHS